MELSKDQIKMTKGMAILFMLLLHLFCTKSYEGLYTPIIMIKEVPLIYYLALFGDCCVAIYCFCSGYGLMISYKGSMKDYRNNNLIRILKLYINYWIVIIMFIVILGPIMEQADKYLGSIKEFILNFTAVSPSYNGAWWFITTYIILVLLSEVINKIVIKYNNLIILGISLILYFLAYVQRIKGVMTFDNIMLNWLIRQVALLGTSQLPFIIGAIFAEKKLYSKVYVLVNKIKFKSILCVSIIFLMVIIHSLIETLFIAVFTGIVFICCFNLMDKQKFVNELLSYFGTHSTNLWFTHMFFYMIYFKKVVFYPQYSILIFLWLIVLCLAASYIINLIYKPVVKLVSKYILSEKNRKSSFLKY